MKHLKPAGSTKPGDASALLPESAPPVLDPAIFGSLRELLDGPILARTYREFLVQTRLRLKTFAVAADEKAVRAMAHNLRGTAAMLGANRIAASVAQLEEKAASSQLIAQVVERLHAECARLESALRKEQVQL